MSLNRYLILVFLFTFNIVNLAQFKITQIPSGIEQLDDSLFLGLTSSRTITSLNNNWNIYFADEPKNSSKVSFPVTFTSQKSLIFERKFDISAIQIINNFIKLNFLGINYTAEVFVNNAALYKHPGGEIPFSIDLPDDILNYDTPNTLQIKIQYNIDSENTIPLLQRFLFPNNYGGIFRDVYLSFRPKIGIKNIKYFLEDDKKPYKGKLNFSVNIEDFTKTVSDSLLENFDGRFKIEASLNIVNDTNLVYHNIWNISPTKTDNFEKSFFIRLRKISKWSPSSPFSYLITLKLTNGDGFIYDEFKENIKLIDFKKEKNELHLNKKIFNLKGVTYIRSNIKSISNYEQIEKDIKTIKESGFNTVRFSKVFPHPYAVYLCDKLGLFSFIELPLNSVPERFTSNANFIDRATSFLERAIKHYDNYNTIIAYGVGGSYLSNSEKHIDFISNMNSFIKKNSTKLSYASFIGKSSKIKPEIDLYGLEIFATNPNDLLDTFAQQNLEDTTIYFISEATYPTFKGATTGYLNSYSFEGQAKFFDDIITVSNKSTLNGFFLNTMFDYSGDYSPFFSGFEENNNYNIGIVSNEGTQSRISFNLIKSRLTNSSKVSIPIGSNDEDAPLFFIIAALIISVIIALLINSKRKFREDATRALLRPYNFFADIRDQRILSGFHSNILLLLLGGANSLLLTILLYFLKSNILLERIVISFGSYKFSSFISYLAWHPQKAFMYIYAATVIAFILVSFLVHLSSFFVKTKVLFFSVYSVAIWAFLPIALLLPIEAILFKILLTHTFNNYIFIFLLLFAIWNIQRFLKGIYVIFDIRPFFIYLYSFIMVLIILLSIGFYFQFSASTFDYISLAIKQYAIV